MNKSQIQPVTESDNSWSYILLGSLHSFLTTPVQGWNPTALHVHCTNVLLMPVNWTFRKGRDHRPTGCTITGEAHRGAKQLWQCNKCLRPSNNVIFCAWGLYGHWWKNICKICVLHISRSTPVFLQHWKPALHLQTEGDQGQDVCDGAISDPHVAHIWYLLWLLSNTSVFQVHSIQAAFRKFKCLQRF